MRPWDEKFMMMALNLAKKGEGRTSPNPMVGAIVVRSEKVVGKGHHHGFGLPHAEVNALKDAGTKARGATLYLNLEPCCYFGKTPPCTDTIIQAGIKRVVCAVSDPNPKVKGKGFKKLKEKGIKVDVGILKKDALRLNEIYFKFIKTKLPFLIVSLTQTLDGRLIHTPQGFESLFSEKAKKIVKNLRSKVDAILRQNKLEFSPKSEGLSWEDWGAKNEAKELISLLKRAGKSNITSILVEDGKENLTHLMRKRLVDKIYYFISAQIMGRGVEPFGDLGVWKISDTIYLKDREVNIFSDSKNASHNILIIGYPVWRKYQKE